MNGHDVSIDVGPQTPLLEVLRNDFKLNAPKFGCGLAQCGACSVHVDGVSTRACVLPVVAVDGKAVTTLEGLGGRANPHPLQEAFIAEQALQCGYCVSGIIISAAALLERNPTPTDAEIRKALSGHLCRCGAQPRMLKAVARAAAKTADAG
ncbi:MAG: (2Fe-2S)-binding protein [Woeseiaceae bacterium]|nr:(2Fe-2S)-binding protein [Woeseiaceae bacterium]